MSNRSFSPVVRPKKSASLKVTFPGGISEEDARRLKAWKSNMERKKIQNKVSLICTFDRSWRNINSKSIEAQAGDKDGVMALKTRSQLNRKAESMIICTLPHPGTRARPWRGHSCSSDNRRARKGGWTAPKVSQGVTLCSLKADTVKISIPPGKWFLPSLFPTLFCKFTNELPKSCHLLIHIAWFNVAWQKQVCEVVYESRKMRKSVDGISGQKGQRNRGRSRVSSLSHQC